MLSWQVGRVKVTRIVEMDLPVPAQFMRGATLTSYARCRGSIRTSSAPMTAPPT
jgi:hypothetical protein